MIDFLITNSESEFISSQKCFELINAKYSIYSDNIDFKLESENRKLIIIGDCINSHEITDLNNIDISWIVNNLKGNFYVILVIDKSLYIASSALGLLPIFYVKDYSIISSSVILIEKYAKCSFTENKGWLINQLLFNYQFGNDSLYNEIKLFPALSFLKIENDGSEFIKYFRVQDGFVKQALSANKSVKELSKIFIEIAEKYIPNDGSIISFTGGFDGRTLVSIATYYGKKFSTFSYGKAENDDVFIPLKNSDELGIPYFWLKLDKNYSKDEYFNSSKAFIENTSGSNGLLYAHVDYSARKVKEKSDILISGVCGSELFRAAHASGAVTSKALIDLFKFDNKDEYQKAIWDSKVFKHINKNDYLDEITLLIDETWDYKDNLPSGLSKNEKLYIFVYEEIFRKFFGAWVKAQMKHVKIRTPFVDFDFFKKIITTELSGAYSDFLTENPLKRFKGQLLYAKIIKDTNPAIYKMKTGKGYAPNIVGEAILRPLLLIPFLTKRLKRKVKKTNFDNLGIISGIKLNREVLDAYSIDRSNTIDDQTLDRLNNFTPENERDTILSTIAISIMKKKNHDK